MPTSGLLAAMAGSDLLRQSGRAVCGRVPTLQRPLLSEPGVRGAEGRGVDLPWPLQSARLAFSVKAVAAGQGGGLEMPCRRPGHGSGTGPFLAPLRGGFAAIRAVSSSSLARIRSPVTLLTAP